MKHLAMAYEQYIVRTLRSAEQIAALVREQYALQGSHAHLSRWTEQGIIRESMFRILSVVDAQGRIVASSSASGATGIVNYADRAFFIFQRESTKDILYISHPVVGRLSGRWQVPLSLRITRPNGSFGGVVVLSVDTQHFTDFYQDAHARDDGLLELIGADGVVRSRSLGGQHSFGAKADALAWFAPYAPTSTHSDTNSVGQAAAAEQQSQQSQHLQQPQNFQEYLIDDGTSLDGKERIISYRRVQGYPLWVAVGTGLSKALADVHARRAIHLRNAGIASAVLLAFAVLLLVALARQRAIMRMLHTSEAQFRATFHQATTGIAHIAPEGRFLDANRKFCRVLGYSLEQLQGLTLLELTDPDDRVAAQEHLTRCLCTSPTRYTHTAQEVEKRYRRRDGSVLWVCEALAAVRDKRGQVIFLVAVVQDISARKALEERLSYAALHDPLTGLPNRTLFQDRLEQALQSARRNQELLAVLYVDLDGFKAVNDQWGHSVGDVLLQQVAQRLQMCLRAHDTVARFGGDEFGIVLPALTHVQDCDIVARKVLEALAAEFDLGQAHVYISASIGVALFPTQGHDAATLLVHADNAMYHTKHHGKNGLSYAA